MSERASAPREDGGASVPRYRQLADAVKRRILDGAYPVGSQLPTEAQLREEFDVSRHTVREALRCLREDQLISSRQGSGTTVLPPAPPDQLIIDATLVNEMAAHAQDVFLDIHSQRVEHLGAEKVELIGLPFAGEWLVVTGLGESRNEKGPLCFCEYYIHRDYAAVARILKQQTNPIFMLIENLFGERITDIEQEFSAGIIPDKIADKLHVERNTAAAKIARKFRTAQGKLAMLTVHVHPADRFCFKTHMRRS